MVRASIRPLALTRRVRWPVREAAAQACLHCLASASEVERRGSAGRARQRARAAGRRRGDGARRRRSSLDCNVLGMGAGRPRLAGLGDASDHARPVHAARPRDARRRAGRRPGDRGGGHAGLPAEHERLPQLPGDGRRDPAGRGRLPRHRPRVLDRQELPGPRHLGRQDQRQRRPGRGRARGPHRRPPPRARAPDHRAGARDAAVADPGLRHRRHRHAPREHPRDLRDLRAQPRRHAVRPDREPVPRLAQEPPAEPRPERRHRPQPQLRLPVRLLRRLVGQREEHRVPRRARVLGPRDPGHARLRAEPRGRRRPADPDAHHAPHQRRADPVAVRLHEEERAARHDGPRPADVRVAGPGDGANQRLHRRAVVGPVHHRRRPDRLAVREVPDLHLHVRAVPDREADRPGPTTTPTTRRSRSRRPATARRSCCSSIARPARTRPSGPRARQQDCGPLYDDLEINRGWSRDPKDKDTASSGLWAVTNPAATTLAWPEAAGRRGVGVGRAGHGGRGGPEGRIERRRRRRHLDPQPSDHAPGRSRRTSAG